MLLVLHLYDKLFSAPQWYSRYRKSPSVAHILGQYFYRERLCLLYVFHLPASRSFKKSINKSLVISSPEDFFKSYVGKWINKFLSLFLFISCLRLNKDNESSVCCYDNTILSVCNYISGELTDTSFLLLASTCRSLIHILSRQL